MGGGVQGSPPFGILGVEHSAAERRVNSRGGGAGEGDAGGGDVAPGLGLPFCAYHENNFSD